MCLKAQAADCLNKGFKIKSKEKILTNSILFLNMEKEEITLK